MDIGVQFCRLSNQTPRCLDPLFELKTQYTRMFSNLLYTLKEKGNTPLKKVEKFREVYLDCEK